MNTLSEKPKLSVVSSYEFQDTNATKARLSAYLEILKQSFQITFLCPNGSDDPSLDGVTLKRIGRTPIRGVFILRAFREFMYAVRALMMLRSTKADIIMVTSPSMFLLLLLISKSCPTILDLRDLNWEYLSESGSFQRFIKLLFRHHIERLISKSDVVFVTNEQEYQHVKEVFKKRSVAVPLMIVRNGISRQRFEQLRTIQDIRNPNRPTLLYVGNVGVAQDLTTLIDAIEFHPDITVIIVGKGSDMNRVKSYAAKKLINNIIFTGGISWVEILPYYACADVLYAQITADFELAIPSKLYEYLTVGIPIIFGGRGAAARFTKNFNNIELVEPRNPDELSAAITRSKKVIGCTRNNKNPEQIFKKYLREGQVENVLPIFNLLVNPQASLVTNPNLEGMNQA